MRAIFIDLETTGLDFDKHIVLDVGVVIADLNDMSTTYAYTSCISCDAVDWLMADENILEINGFNKENHWQTAKKDHEVTKELIKFFKKYDVEKGKDFFICNNSSLDRSFFLQLMSQELMEELNLPYHWLDLASMYWMKYYACFHPIPSPHCIIPELCCEVSLSKDSIAKHLGIPSENKPQRALQGALHLLKCYMWLTGRSDATTKKLSLPIVT